MKEQFYFKNEDAEICYTKDYFIDDMKFEGITELEVMKAIPDKVGGIFWCKVECFCGDDSQDTCGRQCQHYSPRNGISGCCRHYTTRLYTHGEKVILKINQ